ncbi:DUF2570 family protein [Marinobacter sp. LM1]|uniref:DUF2570 family protein n=1 Tax=Marinobacter sp. LM1 TaxID=3003349 RepID=UPI0036D339A5
MIGKLLTSKALPWLSGGLVVLILGLLATVYALHSRNSALNEKVGTLNTENTMLAESLRSQSESYQALATEIQKRDELIAQAQQSRQTSERKFREQIEALRQALADDECAGRPHPPAVADILRAGSSDRVQD